MTDDLTNDDPEAFAAYIARHSAKQNGSALDRARARLAQVLN